MKRSLIFTFSLLLLIAAGKSLRGQSASVSPSRLYYDVPLGEYKTQSVKVTNNSQQAQAFQISFADFESPGVEGKTKMMKPGESEHSCSQWLSANPSFFELQPGESKDINILMQVPNTAEANKAKWATMMVKLARERKDDQSMSEGYGFGINQTFQFVVHVFQQPPTVQLKSGEIHSFKQIESAGDSIRQLELQFMNTGEAILDCASYVEMTDLSDGTTRRLDIRAFTVLPDGVRHVVFDLPENVAPGRYSLLGVVDYGSDEEVQAAEITIEIPNK